MNTLLNEQAAKAFADETAIEWEVIAPGMKRKIMAYDDSLMLVKVEFEKGGVGTLHHHYHTQISYVVSGKFEVEIDGKKKVLSQGDVFFVAPDVVHGAVCLEAGILLDMFSPKREEFVTSK